LTVLICQIRKREEFMVSDKSEDEDEDEDEDEEGGFGSASGRRLPTTTTALHVMRGPPRRETGTGTERESGGRYQVPTT
jgi:hypothetical protein